MIRTVIEVIRIKILEYKGTRSSVSLEKLVYLFREA
jgi:hypothetical protein